MSLKSDVCFLQFVKGVGNVNVPILVIECVSFQQSEHSF